MAYLYGSNCDIMNIPKWINDLLIDKKYRIVKHIMFWLFIYSDEFLSLIGITSPFESGFGPILLEMLGDMIMVYFNIYYLLPKFLLKGKIITYIFWTLLITMFIIQFNMLIFDISWSEEGVLSHVVSNIAANITLVFMAVAMKLISRTYQDNTQISKLREDKLKTELAYLKTQVNPHFLFNTLNNVYVMSKKKDDNVPETIMQLSELLRYQLYDTTGDTVPLKNEINYLKNYIDLEKIRRGDLVVDFDVKVDDLHMAIRPLIFLPFIENAFKYSNTNSGTDSIRILFEKRGDKLIFECKNNKGTLHSGVSGGIGLENATRRLELSYPSKHTINILDEEDTFTVKVEIDQL